MIETGFELFIPIMISNLIDIGVANHDVNYIYVKGVQESGFAFTAGWLNIALYVLSLALGFWLMARLTKTGGLSWLCGVLVIAAGLYGAALILFTMAPPALPIFLD